MKQILIKIFISAYFTLIQSVILCYGQDITISKYVLRSDILYRPNDTLKTDIYLPLNYKKQKNPVLIFFDANDSRAGQHYTDWAKLSASEGFVSVLFALQRTEAKQDFEALLDFIEKNTGIYSINPEQIAIYAASGNVFLALPIANENEKIKAALIYYGTADIKNFRFSLPVLLVRTGLDNISLNKRMDTLSFMALQANAPYTIMNYSSAIHAFEDVSEPEVRKQMLASLNFLKMNMNRAAQDRISKAGDEIIAMKELYQSNWGAAITAFKRALKNNPRNSETERQMGNTYIELKEYENAINSFNDALNHGNWRKGEIAGSKCLAYASMNNIEGAIIEMRILKKIGWFRESDYTSNPIFKNVVDAEAYKNFIRE